MAPCEGGRHGRRFVRNGGLVRRMGSDDEIAGVMGHEMAHVPLKHNEKFRLSFRP